VSQLFEGRVVLNFKAVSWRTFEYGKSIFSTGSFAELIMNAISILTHQYLLSSACFVPLFERLAQEITE
jgi:hypothetical protein